MRDVRLLLLGPVRLWRAGELVPVGPTSQQLVLAALAIDAGRPVTVATMLERVFAGQRPPAAEGLLDDQVETLARALVRGGGTWELRRHDGGYTLCGSDGTDLDRFRALVVAAEADGIEGPARAEVLQEGLDLWRGPALADLPGAWVTGVRRALHRERDEALALWARMRIVLGDGDAVLGPVQEALAQEPGNALLAEVLAEAVRRPGGGPASRPANPPAPVAPAQLPLAVPGFVGRRSQLDTLDALLETSGESAGTVAAIWGPPGIGKTVLALGWAHRVAHQFPDGQLYLDLRGFDQVDHALDTAAAVRSLLYGLGVAPDQIPGGLDAQLALYRSVLAGKRVLIVLDNAVTAEHVRPLLPGAPDCRTVVTSRSELTSLISLDGARPVTMPLFTAEEAQRMLALRLGTARVTDDAEAISGLIGRCAGLPLALAIAASYAASHPHHSLRSLVDDAGDDLELFTDSDPAADLRAVFSWSYRSLTPGAARLFRLVGLHNGPDVTQGSCANLAGLSVADVRPILSELARASLLTEHRRGRFHMHALLRTYAVELSRTYDPAADRTEALRRLLDHYLGTSAAAATLLFPQLVPLSLPRPAPGVTTQSIVDSEKAVQWFAAEWETVVACVATAAGLGLSTHAWQLAMAVGNYLDRRGFWPEQLRVTEAALEATRSGDDDTAVARMHRAVAIPCIRLGRYDDAVAHLREAMAIYGPHGNELHRAHTHSTLAISLENLGDLRAALAEAVLGLDLFRKAGDALGEANGLNAIGWIHGRLGEFDLAERYSREALSAFELADRTDLAGEATTWHTLGVALHNQGRHSEAVVAHRESLRRYRQGEIVMFTARGLVHLGDTYVELGDVEQARVAWTEAMAMLREIDHAGAERVRSKLEQLDDRSGAATTTDHRSPLTPRETEVARCVGQGLTNKQIARRMDISEWTVVNHMREIMRKLECTSRVQVARWAWDALPAEESSA
jgi:DNA-binding CsgD family transcriptional regulator/tetratricopeptide (TPR) repeat protein/DNA-binding SARP family transcriptional activator